MIHPFGPTEIEVALGERGPNCTRDVGPSFGPIEAQPAEVASGYTQCGKVDSKVGEKTSACWRDFSGFVAEYDVFLRSEKIGQVHTEATGEVVIANSGCTEFPCLTRQRAVSRSGF